jgi:hypothetical protein
MVLSKIDSNHKNISLPGGTLSLTIGHMVNRIEIEIVDKYGMGRWSGNTYQLGNQKKLSIVTAYRVNDQPVTAKNIISTNSQQHHLLKKRNLCEKPRRQFIIDFCEQFKQMFIDTNNYNILMIDTNENYEIPDVVGIQELIKELGLVKNTMILLSFQHIIMVVEL